MAKAKKLPSGNWRVLLFVGYDAKGKRKYESFTAPTPAEANLLADQRKYEIERGINNDRQNLNITVGEAIDRYIDDRDGVLSPKTVREYRTIRRNDLQGIMSVKLSKLTSAALQRAINTDAKAKAPKTVHNAYGLFTSSIAYVAPDLKYSVNLPQREKPDIRIPTEEELQALFEITRGTNMEVPVLLGATAGMRRGEIAALDLKKDIDYKSGEIKITKALAQNDADEWVLKKTKSTSGKRLVRIPPWVVERLQELREDYTMPTANAITKGFERNCAKLGFSFRFHDLRHYYASSLIAVGAPVQYIMARMGHNTPDMVNKVYGHIMDAKDKEINTASDAWFDKLKPSEK